MCEIWLHAQLQRYLSSLSGPCPYVYGGLPCPILFQPCPVHTIVRTQLYVPLYNILGIFLYPVNTSPSIMYGLELETHLKRGFRVRQFFPKQPLKIHRFLDLQILEIARSRYLDPAGLVEGLLAGLLEGLLLHPLLPYTATLFTVYQQRCERVPSLKG